MDGDLRVEPLSEHTLEDALAIIHDSFSVEPTHSSESGQGSEEREFLALSLKPEKTRLFSLLEFIVLRKGKEVVGIIGIEALRYEGDGNAWTVYPAVKKGHQRQGYGTMLWIELEKLAKRLGIRRLYADTSTSQDDPGSKKILEKLGYKKVGGIIPYFDDDSGLDYWMKHL